MKKLIVLVVACWIATVATASAQDVREAAKKAEADRQAAEARAAAVEAKITSDRATLTAEVEKLEAQAKQLSADVQALQKRKASQQTRHDALTEKWSTKEVEFREISGNVRIAAKDIEALLNTSQLTGLFPERLNKIAPVLEPGYFPGIDDISGMTQVLFDEMTAVRAGDAPARGVRRTRRRESQRRHPDARKVHRPVPLAGRSRFSHLLAR